MLIDSGRQILTDQKFNDNEIDSNYANKYFLRLVAKGRHFKNVDFKYSIFDSCYLRNCQFESCNFTGCRFIGSNLYGSSFSGCRFEYATFERTMVDGDILDSSCPGYENLKAKFARTLRVNFQQIGDTKSANGAIEIELSATREHLLKSWRSKESYYRHKYRGWVRLLQLLRWLKFKSLEYIWGNGESVAKLLRAVLVALVVICIYDTTTFGQPMEVSSYWFSARMSLPIFFGVDIPEHYPTSAETVIFLVRLILFSFFISIVLKKFNRR